METEVNVEVKKMKEGVLIISQTCSPDCYADIEKFNTTILPSQQKLFLALAQGLAKRCFTKCISVRPAFPKTNRKRVWKQKHDQVDELQFYYTSFVNYPILKHLTSLLSTMFYLLINSRKIKKRYSCVIMDPLLSYLVMPCKWLLSRMGLRTIALVTDLPSHVSDIHSKQKIRMVRRFYNYLGEKSTAKYDGYILLTKQMNAVVNPFARPSIIMEGILDKEIYHQSIELHDIAAEKQEKDVNIVLYAGGINEKFGLFSLIEAFKMVNASNWELHIYGSGADSQLLEDVLRNDKRVKFFGRVDSSKIFAIERAADILINPRPIEDEFTKFSFPSKTLEYLASGVVTMSTRLPGIPKEYEPFIKWIVPESIVGIKDALISAMRLTEQERIDFGAIAKKYVIDNKNHVVQAKRVMRFIEKTLRALTPETEERSSFNDAEVKGRIDC